MGSSFDYRTIASAEKILEPDAAFSLRIPVLHYHWSVDREALLPPPTLRDGSRPRDHNGPGRNLQRTLALPPVYSLLHEIIHRRATGKNSTCSQDRSLAHQCPFVDAAITPDEDIVFHDYGQGSHRLEDTSDLAAGAQVHALADLGT